MITEDDLMIADLVEDALVSSGYSVCGIARTVAEGVLLGRLHHPDLAIVDMRLAEGGLGSQIVEQLHAGPRIGVLYANGNINQVIDQASGDACIAKLFDTADLLRVSLLVQQILHDDTASPPFPREFHLLNNNGSLCWEGTHA
jgi:DNA-binding response OmpR family regulator